jgi:hypothetical protein
VPIFNRRQEEKASWQIEERANLERSWATAPVSRFGRGRGRLVE